MSEHSLPRGVNAKDIAKRMATGHSVFSPSGADTWMTCAGSLIPNLLADDETSEDAAEGTVAHSVAERWLKTGREPVELVGTTETVGDHDIEITEEMLGYVGDFVAYVDDIEGEKKLYEQRVDFSQLVPIKKQTGTADVIILEPGHLHVVDLKYGKGIPVFTHGDDGYVNKQLRIYALGAFYEYDEFYDFQSITIHICQPRLDYMRGYTISREELLAFAEEVRECASRAWQADAPRTASIKGCQWCKVKSTCSANYLFLARLTDDVFEDYDSPQEFSSAEMAGALVKLEDPLETDPFGYPPDPAQLSTWALANVLRYRPLMEKWFNSIHNELLDRAVSREEEIPFWKTVEGRANRKYVEDEEFIVSELTSKGLERDELFETKMLSPAAMERLLHTKAGHKVKDAASILTGLTVKPQGRKTLVQTADRRKALASDGEVFTDYTATTDENE